MQILREQQHSEEHTEPSGTWPTKSHRQTSRILVADDDPQVLRVIVRVLRHAGLDVHSANSSAEALRLIEAFPFDAVVTDLFAPATNGTLVLAAVREHALLVPVILISGGCDPRNTPALVGDAALHFLAKPFCARELAELIARLT